MERVRIDKWLWAARVFKTRSLAARACELGRIEANGHPAKASREVHVGDKLQIRTDAGEFNVDVLILSEMRGPASVAQMLYQEPEGSRLKREQLAAERKAMYQQGLGDGKLSKRDRRIYDKFRGR